LKIEEDSHGGKTTIYLVGRFQWEHIPELKNQLRKNGPQFIFDLTQVTLVDVDVVRFLSTCETAGVVIVNCSQYIREWMLRERDA
jgi:anti-anti-sigma regulatory factor